MICIVGAGFSGLTLAWELSKRGLAVEIWEQSDHISGLISSHRDELSLRETAANALIWTPEIESLLQELELPWIPTRPEAKKRFFFRRGLKRWPLSFFESLALGIKISPAIFLRKRYFKPKDRESILDWGRRVLTEAATKFLLEPALQGIYAGDISKMSASLVLGSLFQKKRAGAPRYRGSLSFEQGMGELIERLQDRLVKKGVIFRKQSPLESYPHGKAVVLAVSAASAAKILKTRYPDLSDRLSRVQMLPLASVTLVFGPQAHKIEGFGVLFPRGQGVRSLGVLANSMIFESRGPCYSETWLMGGAQDLSVAQLTDKDCEAIALADREKLAQTLEKPLRSHVQIWAEALPHANQELKDFVDFFQERQSEVWLTGNYLGGLGLSKIYSWNCGLAEKIQNSLETKND